MGKFKTKLFRSLNIQSCFNILFLLRNFKKPIVLSLVLNAIFLIHTIISKDSFIRKDSYIINKSQLIDYVKLLNLNIELENRILNETAPSLYNNFIKRKSIFCMILTTPKGFLNSKPQTVLNLWAYKCDNFKFVAILPEKAKIIKKNFQFEFEHSNFILEPNGLKEDTYQNLTNKVLLAFKHIYKDYNDYDWYLKADDDTFVNLDNLRYFLRDKNPNLPVTYGHDFRLFVDKGYHSGGAGYVLSNQAFNRLGKKLNSNANFCNNSGIEDVDVGVCLRKLEVYPNKTIDELGRERFNPMDLTSTFAGFSTDWLYNYSSNPFRKGLDCCSDTFISFHKMTKENMTRLDTVIKLLSKKLMSNSQNNSSKINTPLFKDIILNYIKLENLEFIMQT